ncbi:MAG: alpha/beta hydrolase [Pedobacter sp.]|nr:MAG: alpha/beta hydrolase [Pedobacter sp.]
MPLFLRNNRPHRMILVCSRFSNVSILHDSFHFPTLDRYRRIWVYLPDGYHDSDQRYPVIYMHDGQNLFDEMSAFGSEWGVDETLDGVQGKVIIIGIENGAEHRMSEYMIYDHPEHGPGEGGIYLKDLSEVLKPWVDAHLRTIPNPEQTGIAGSSMGGLITLYAGLYLPHVFSVVGVFSPASQFSGWFLHMNCSTCLLCFVVILTRLLS